MKLKLSGILLVLIFAASYSQKKSNYDYANPFIGTDYMGHCYPGATIPFGMVQLSPDTDMVPHNIDGKYNKGTYAYCSGYQYKDKTIVGFSHTHFSGTGHSDLGDFLVMPTVGEIKTVPGTKNNPDSGYRSRFSKNTEKATPGYYAVKLDDYNVDVELTATNRVGIHKYRFPKSEKSNIILDLTHNIYNYDGKIIWASVRVENEKLITGYYQTRGWARAKFLYFAMELSKPIENYGVVNKEKVKYGGFWRRWNQKDNFPQMEGKKLVPYFTFKTNANEEILVKFAISAVSAEGALKNLRAEAPHNDFNKYRANAKKLWEKEFNIIDIDGSREKKERFYTSLYHSCLSPTVYMDVDGKYRGLDQNIHQADGFTNYTTFSLWDTFRAQHPLLTITHPQRAGDMVNSMIKHYEQSVHKLLPVWSHHANENWCMIGYHAVPVIVDAYMKGIRNYDVEKAFESVVSSATHKGYDGLGEYMKYGYIPFDKGGSSASVTLEYAYDDWTIARFAEELGKEKEAAEFSKRSQYYRNLWDSKTKFIRAKDSKGVFKPNFDPMETHGMGYIEGNAYNYSMFVPHDPKGLVDLYGGGKKFSKFLDKIFTLEMPEESYAHTEDIEKNGLIGTYVHGNEPGHHIPYLYMWTDKPWKTQMRVHQIVNTMYGNTPNGVCGNDDCGQMSAWYIFSTLGFYPVSPGSNQYVFGSPCTPKAVLNLSNGKTFTVEAENLSDKNIYIQSVTINGKRSDNRFITHSTITNGGTLKFKMGSKPNKRWGKIKPYSMTK